MSDAQKGEIEARVKEMKEKYDAMQEEWEKFVPSRAIATLPRTFTQFERGLHTRARVC